ncbi:hypothetical protein J2733_003219 [Chitinophaga ginsengisegetis]|nr:hypothetical protein [Chitinophaga ginsengisegetis]
MLNVLTGSERTGYCFLNKFIGMFLQMSFRCYGVSSLVLGILIVGSFSPRAFATW